MVSIEGVKGEERKKLLDSFKDEQQSLHEELKNIQKQLREELDLAKVNTKENEVGNRPNRRPPPKRPEPKVDNKESRRPTNR